MPYLVAAWVRWTRGTFYQDLLADLVLNCCSAVDWPRIVDHSSSHAMPRRSRRLALAIVLVLLAALVAVLRHPVQRAWAVGALQRGVHYSHTVYVNLGDRPAALPAWLDDAAHRLFVKTAVKSMIPSTQANLTRFRSFFSGPIERICLQGPFTDDPVALLTGFPHLRQLTVYELETLAPDSVSTESAWARVCTAAHACPRLEVLALFGDQFTDASLAPLAGHPTLREIGYGGSTLTPACVATLAKLPKLTELHINNGVDPGSPAISSDDIPAMQSALPGVKIFYTRSASSSEPFPPSPTTSPTSPPPPCGGQDPFGPK